MNLTLTLELIIVSPASLDVMVARAVFLESLITVWVGTVAEVTVVPFHHGSCCCCCLALLSCLKDE